MSEKTFKCGRCGGTFPDDDTTEEERVAAFAEDFGPAAVMEYFKDPASVCTDCYNDIKAEQGEEKDQN